MRYVIRQTPVISFFFRAAADASLDTPLSRIRMPSSMRHAFPEKVPPLCYALPLRYAPLYGEDKAREHDGYVTRCRALLMMLLLLRYCYY